MSPMRIYVRELMGSVPLNPDNLHASQPTPNANDTRTLAGLTKADQPQPPDHWKV